MNGFVDEDRGRPGALSPVRRTEGAVTRAASVLLITLLACALSGSAVTGWQAASLTAERRAEHLASFDQIWTTVRDQYWDATLNGVDWERAKRELRPKVDAATTDDEARAAMAALIGRLGQSHFQVVPRELFELIGNGDRALSGDTGLRVRVLDGRAIVTSVVAASPADRAGARPGWEIVRIGTIDVRPRLQRLARELPDSLLKPADLATAVSSRLSGRIGGTIDITCDTGEGPPRDVVLPLEVPQGARTSVGNLPPVYVRTETRVLSGGVGYFGLSAFVNPVHVMGEFGKAVERHRDASGLVIDLRGNTGGAFNIVTGVLGWLVPDQGRQVGTMHGRTLTLKIVVQPRPAPFAGPVAVLVDGLSMSASEVLAAALQDTGRARVFGSRTAGAVLASTIERLPNGDRFQYAYADYLSATGRRLEGHGVVPDQEVLLTRDALIKGRDPVIDAAVEWIRQRRQSWRDGR